MNADARIRKGRKFDQVIEGAKAVFLREGFEGASVDEIARDAGVSKATLYSYFPDKQHLFLAVIENRNAPTSRSWRSCSMPPIRTWRKRSGSSARRSSPFFLSRFGTGHVPRLRGRGRSAFPELGRSFYDSGPRKWGRKIAQYLDSPGARAVLEIEDSPLAADQLAQLCRADLMLKVLFGIEKDPPEAEIDRVAEEAVKTFLAR